MEIITNNVPRDIIWAGELTAEEQAEFDYINWTDPETISATFVRYKGQLIDLDDLEGPIWGWDAHMSDSFFSGILVRWVNDFEQVIMGRYYG